VKGRRSYAERKLREEVIRFARANWGVLAYAVVCTGVVAALPLLIGSPPYASGFALGFTIAAMIGIVIGGFLLAGDGALLIAGTFGEAYADAAVAKARERGLVWDAVSNVEASGRDVDLVVFAPCGVMALESKWRFRGAGRQWLAEATAAARDGARQAQLVLMSKGIEYRTEVQPVLVVWGGAMRELPNEQIVAGVPVVRGDFLLTWLERCQTGRLAQDHASAVHQKLRAFADARRPA
jgi:hypothetical protein